MKTFLLKLILILGAVSLFLTVPAQPTLAAPRGGCTTVSFAMNPDLGRYEVSLAQSFRIIVNGLERNTNYAIGIKDERGGLVVNQEAADSSIRNPQNSGSGTSLTFGPFNSVSQRWNVSTGLRYTATVYQNIGGWDPCTPSQSFFTTSGSTTTGRSGNAQTDACTPSGGGEGVYTALGCIPTSVTGLANAVLNLALGIAGALAIIFIIIGGFKVATSQGDPDSLQDGKDMITQAIVGLVFILLATTILSIIGIDILGMRTVFQRTGVGGLIINLNP